MNRHSNLQWILASLTCIANDHNFLLLFPDASLIVQVCMWVLHLSWNCVLEVKIVDIFMDSAFPLHSLLVGSRLGAIARKSQT